MHASSCRCQAVSLGGVESLVVHAAAMWRGTMNDEQMRVAGIAPNAVRLSVGIEGVDDLRADSRRRWRRYELSWERRAGVHRLSAHNAVGCATFEMET